MIIFNLSRRSSLAITTFKISSASSELLLDCIILRQLSAINQVWISRAMCRRLWRCQKLSKPSVELNWTGGRPEAGRSVHHCTAGCILGVRRLGKLDLSFSRHHQLVSIPVAVILTTTVLLVCGYWSVLPEVFPVCSLAPQLWRDCGHHRKEQSMSLFLFIRKTRLVWQLPQHQLSRSPDLT